MFSIQTIKQLFLTEAKDATKKSEVLNLAEENDFSALPEILKRYISSCGYTKEHKVLNAVIKWDHAMIRFSPNSKWKKLVCYQLNFVKYPVRLVYFKTRLWKIIPVEALDKYMDSTGNMLIKILKFFTITNAKGKEINEAELVTLLAETILIPAYALQKYITWTIIDPFLLQGIIQYRGLKVSGLFYFNEYNEITRFETQDRYWTQNGNQYQRMQWTAIARHYIEKNGIRFPQEFSAVWNTKHGDYEYFKGTISAIELNQPAMRFQW